MDNAWCYHAIVNSADQRLWEELLVPVSYPQAAAFNTERCIHMIPHKPPVKFIISSTERKIVSQMVHNEAIVWPCNRVFNVAIATITADEIFFQAAERQKVSMISDLPISIWIAIPTKLRDFRLLLFIESEYRELSSFTAFPAMHFSEGSNGSFAVLIYEAQYRQVRVIIAASAVFAKRISIASCDVDRS